MSDAPRPEWTELDAFGNVAGNKWWWGWYRDTTKDVHTTSEARKGEAMRHAREVIQELEDAGPEPRARVKNYAAVWDGDLGFAWHVEAGNEAAFAAKLRQLADAVEAKR